MRHDSATKLMQDKNFIIRLSFYAEMVSSLESNCEIILMFFLNSFFDFH